MPISFIANGDFRTAQGVAYMDAGGVMRNLQSVWTLTPSGYRQVFAVPAPSPTPPSPSPTPPSPTPPSPTPAPPPGPTPLVLTITPPDRNGVTYDSSAGGGTWSLNFIVSVANAVGQVAYSWQLVSQSANPSNSAAITSSGADTATLTFGSSWPTRHNTRLWQGTWRVRATDSNGTTATADAPYQVNVNDGSVFGGSMSGTH